MQWGFKPGVGIFLSDVYEFRFDVEPVAWARPRVARSGHMFNAPKMRLAQEHLRFLMKSQFKHFPFETPLRLDVTFFIKRPKYCPKARLYPAVKPDLSNLVKLLEDAGNEILWKDDNLIVELNARKQYGEPGILVRLEKVIP